jgi:phenylacetate-CoA ligase
MTPRTSLKSPTPSAAPKTLLAATAKSVARDREVFPLKLFQAAAVRVPAYKDFLRRNRIKPEKIRSRADLSAVPHLDKQNYLSRYPMEQLCWDGALEGKRLVFTSSSGSTGKPFYFPRAAALDHRSSLIFELALQSMSRGRMPPTLFIVSFGMGVWIGGVISLQSLRLLGERGYPISVITPGSNKKEVFEALTRLAPMYEQVVLGGYPPFVKDVLDEAAEHGFDPAKRPLKVFCAAEAFDETFREYVMKKAGAKDPLFDTANLYGTADIGTMAIETPVSIALRRRALEDDKLYVRLFSGAEKLPTLAQFHPGVVDFEEQGGRLYVTGDNALPLVRYDIGDHGGVRGFDEAMTAAEASSPGIASALRSAGAPMPPLPFVYVYERADFSTKLYGAIIYAEHVRAALLVPRLAGEVTGKFSMSTEHDEKQDEYLDVHVELKRGVEADEDLRQRIRDAMVAGLRGRNAEYRYLSDNLKDRVLPRVKLWPHEHQEHFRPGAKQQWINKRKKAV